MPSIHEPLMVNAIGHSAGAVIFGIFLFLFLRDRAGSKFLRGSWLSLAAAALAFLWDAGSLGALVLRTRSPEQSDMLIAFSFAMLSLLPAVLLHLSLDGNLRAMIASGYVLSAISALLHFWEVVRPGQHTRQISFVLIPVGFGIITAVSVLLLALRKPAQARGKTSRILGAMCLFLFAISFVHFNVIAEDRAWSSELVIHHAGIPLALFVLLQDYRFVLLDAFIRFSANVVLAAVLTLGVFRAAAHWVLAGAAVEKNPIYEALSLTGLCLLLIVFALLRGRVQRWLTRVVFRRPVLEKALQQLQSRSAERVSEAEYLQWAAGELARFMTASHADVVPESRIPQTFPLPASECAIVRNDPRLGWAEAIVPLRLSQGDTHCILLGRRRGGRRYLSEDLEFLARLATAIVEQIERLRNSEVQRLVAQAELRALQSQINPHFLFNALNTLYGIIPREASGARRTVLNLADIFRYFLQTDKTFIPLREELQIVKAYLEIERLRLGPRLQTEIDVDEDALSVLIPILSIQPLVENAIKHGIAAKADPGWLRLKVRTSGSEITVIVEDTGAGIGPAPDKTGAGVGLSNVSRRLQLCYGAKTGVEIDTSGAGTTVQFVVPR